MVTPSLLRQSESRRWQSCQGSRENLGAAEAPTGLADENQSNFDH